MDSSVRVSTGIEGLDHILGGGLPAARFHLVQGDPGAGKTTLGLLAQSALRYRRQLLALKQHFAERGATVLMADDRTSDASDVQLQSLAHGVISLEQLSPVYGPERRRLRVAKMS